MTHTSAQTELNAALQASITEHACDMSDIDVAGVLADLLQYRLSSHASKEACPYASGMENILRSISAILHLRQQPTLKDGYIVEKLQHGISVLFDTMAREDPEMMEQFSPRFRDRLTLITS